jgi:glycosyltransferase involved in cell wall biosynthesis
MLAQITPLILTRDEAANISRSLATLSWANEVVIVDSLSTDATVSIARQFANVSVVERPFDSLAGQSNFGVARCSTEWVMLLDADYIVTDGLVRELTGLTPPADVGAYECAFVYAIGGKALRASLYPPRIVLFRRHGAEVWQDGHAHRVRVNGRVEHLRGTIIHDDRKPFTRFLERQRTYMRQEAAKLRTTPFGALNAPGRLRKLRIVAPFAALAYTLFAKRTILDGLPGLRYAFERFVAECILSIELMKSAQSSGRPSPAGPSSSGGNSRGPGPAC